MGEARRKLATVTPKTTSKKAVLYARVSTKEQEEEGYSIDAQLRLIRKYALDKGLDVVAEFIEAETAKTTGRRQFNQMVSYVKSRDIPVIICEKIDRLYRNLPDRVRIGELDIELHFVKENTVLSKDSKSHEKFVHDIKLVVAKNYIDNLSEETRKGMREKAEQGIWPSYAPLGYVNVSNGARRGIAVDPTMAPLIAEVFTTYATGDSSMQKSRDLAYALGLRSRSGRTISASNIALMLNNPIYVGQIQWNGQLYEGKHEAIVSRDLWNRVQEVMHGKLCNRRGSGILDFTYKGLFTCGHCGCTFTAENRKGKYVYYHCTGRRGRCPGQHTVEEKRITEQIVSILSRLTIEPELLELLRGALVASFADEQEFYAQQQLAAESRVRKLEEKLDRLYLDKLSGDVPLSTYERLKPTWEQELIEERTRLARLRASHSNTADLAVNLLELGSNCHVRFEQANPGQKRDLLRTLCSNLTVREGSVQLSFSEPFNSMVHTLESGLDLHDLETWLPD